MHCYLELLAGVSVVNHALSEGRKQKSKSNVRIVHPFRSIWITEILACFVKWNVLVYTVIALLQSNKLVLLLYLCHCWLSEIVHELLFLLAV
jgi:hypothetical protein